MATSPYPCSWCLITSLICLGSSDGRRAVLSYREKTALRTNLEELSELSEPVVSRRRKARVFAVAMAMASSSAVMATCAIVAQSCRCSLDSFSNSSTSAGSTNPNSVKFPLSTVLRQLKDGGAAENLSVVSERDAILDPQMKFANLMWFRGAYNAQIFVSEDEPADSVVRRFRKAVMQAGVIPECRRRRFFETPQDIVKRKQQNAQRRKSRRFSPRNESFGPGGEKKEGGAGGSSAGQEDDDFWGFAEE